MPSPWKVQRTPHEFVFRVEYSKESEVKEEILCEAHEQCSSLRFSACFPLVSEYLYLSIFRIRTHAHTHTHAHTRKHPSTRIGVGKQIYAPHTHSHTARRVLQVEKAHELRAQTEPRLRSLDLIVHTDTCLQCVAFPFSDSKVQPYSVVSCFTT